MPESDDTIVLDDLVRTAEASRLRRRGAMRFDHAETGEDRDRRTVRTRSSPRVDYSYKLYCGGEIEDFEEEVKERETEPSTPFIPSLLPIIPQHRPKHKHKPRPRPRRTNGCGALVHISAAPRRSPCSGMGFTWSAMPGPGAGSTLVQLDACYFDDETVRARIQRSPCGCVREGIACAVCGNALGTRYAPCSASAHSHTHLPEYSYSFSPAAVSSEPKYTHPPAAMPMAPSVMQTDTEPISYPPLLDRLITTSPTPLSDAERAAYRSRPTPPVQPRYLYGYGYPHAPQPYAPASTFAPVSTSVYDLDGELVHPGSPDKAGEMVLFPDR
ncbi:hypothetical protein H0H92_004559 [Tricholoma furcatifolium]|nr:hypothetical protein H0H92_004559 [Tricholoma furcatifolium]